MSSRHLQLFRPRAFRLLALTLLSVVPACSGEGGGEPVITALEGTWLGHEVGVTEEWSLLIRGQGFYLSGAGTWMRGRFELDAERGEIDFLIGECDCPYVEERALARFRLDRDTLHVAGLEPGRAERPSSPDGGASPDGGEGARAFRFLRFVQGTEDGATPASDREDLPLP